MKKSNFNHLKLDSSKILNRNELKDVFGGSIAASCTADCGDGTSVSCSGAGCVAVDQFEVVPGSALEGHCASIDSGGEQTVKYCDRKKQLF
jgi:hypothetical protein